MPQPQDEHANVTAENSRFEYRCTSDFVLF